MADFASALWNKPAAADSTPAEDPVVRSLRFDPASNSYLQRATGSTDTTWTMAMWVKRSGLTGYQYLFNFGSSKGLAFYTGTNSLYYYNGSTNTSTEVFRDPSAWFHLTMVTTSGTATFYVNGVQVTSNSFSTPRTSSALGTVTFGRWTTGVYDFDGYLADIHFIEGEAKSPTDFIELGDYGNYIPKAYTGSFGTNGFHIDAQPAHDADLLVSSIDRNDGDTLFADAAKGHTITRSGALHSIAVGNPFTGDDRAIYFDGTGDYLSVASSTDFDFSSGSYTYEGWFLFEAFGETPDAIFARGNQSASNEGWAVCTNSSGTLQFYETINDSYNTSSFTFSTNQWYHIALCKNGTTYKVYVDGSEKISATLSSSPDNSRPLIIGKFYDDYAYYNLTGYCYDFRAQQGTDTGGAVPSSKMSKTATTVFLLQPEKDDTDFHDESDSGHTITDYSSPTRTASTPYDAAAKSTAMYFDGTDDNLVVTSDSSFNEFGTGDFTIEMWVNPTDQGSNSFAQMFELYDSNSDRMYLRVERQGSQNVYKFVVNGSDDFDVESDSAPDYGNWQHLAVVRNGTSITMYVDGTAQTDSVTISSSASYSWPSRNLKIAKGNSSLGSGAEYGGYIFDYRITKGTAQYTSNFSSSLQSAPFELNPVYIGGDQSGNKNHFQPTNIDSTDIREDNPFKNYATWNPLIKRSSTSNIFTYSEGNTVATYTGGVAHTSTTIASTGVHYAEFSFSGGTSAISGAGVVRARWNDGSADSYTTTYGGCYYGSSGNVDSPSGSTSVSAVGSDRLGIAFDGANNKADFYSVTSGGTMTLLKSLTSSDSIDFDGSATFTATSHDTGATTITGYFEEGEWYGTAPSVGGTTATALNTSNLAAPTVTPANHFDVLTYNGAYDNYMNYSGTSPQPVTGTDFTPEIVWIKDRDNVSYDYGNGYHGGYWFDNVMGTGYALNTDLDNSSHSGSSLASGEDGISSFNSNGFTVDEADETNYMADTDYSSTPDTAERYVAWCWKLGSSGSSSTWAGGNTNPDTEKYNASAGVSIINYDDSAYSGSAITLNHSLGDAPEFAIAFDYAGYTSGHYVWHKDLSSGNYLTLDSNSAQTSDTDYFPASPVTATTMTLGTSISAGTQSHVALFSGVEGYSKFGTYKGVGGNGVFVYTGHRPKMVWIKNVDTTGSWMMFDSVRDTYNETVNYLQANSSTSETTNSGYKIDILSNGFRINVESTAMNNSAYDYVFCSFAEQPFAAPSNAR